MNAKTALALAALALLSACAGTPTWDNSVFPPQVIYGAPQAGDAAQPAK